MSAYLQRLRRDVRGIVDGTFSGKMTNLVVNESTQIAMATVTISTIHTMVYLLDVLSSTNLLTEIVISRIHISWDGYAKMS